VKRFLSTTFMLACITFSVLGAINVYGDHSDVLRRAELAACAPGSGCHPQLRQLAKTPLWMDFDFDVQKRRVMLRCTREFYMIGEYRCAERGAR
jgi:hypothetical protein